MTFLKIILFVVLFYYLIKLLLRFLFPFIFQYFVSHKMNSYSAGFEKNKKQSKPKEGEITIENISKVKSKSRSYKGEYIDYEEINE